MGIYERLNMSNNLNPFINEAPKQNIALVDIQSARESQEVQAMVVSAKRFPRNQIEAMDRILNACTRPTLAEGAIYSYPRGGEKVEGPSIRLAEAMAQAWGNIEFGIRELSQENGESTVEAFAWDLETNTRQVKVFQVPHKRFTKKYGAKDLVDPRDIYELVANNGARRLRACILGILPGDVIESAVQQCQKTLQTSADVTPEGLKKMVDAFGTLGVTDEMIKTFCQCKIEAIPAAQVVRLKKIFASIRDGMSNISDWFAVPETKTTPSGLNDILDNEQKGE